MGIKKVPRLPHRRGSTASEDDFFDIPDEPVLAILKRQLRHIRTWIIFAVFVLLILYLRRERPPPARVTHIDYNRVDWSRYAYSQYATSSAYLCNAVMVFEALERLGSRAQRVLFYPETWDVDVESSRDRDSQLLRMAAETYGALLIPVDEEMLEAGLGASPYNTLSTEKKEELIDIDGGDGQAPANPGTKASRNCSFSARPSSTASSTSTRT